MRWLSALVLIAPLHCTPCTRARPKSTAQPTMHVGFHSVVLDEGGKIVPWTPLAHVVELAWKGLESFPNQAETGLPTWMTNPMFDPVSKTGIHWPYNPASLNAMLVESALGWYAFSGDRAPLDLVRKSLDHHLEHGMTDASDSWSHVPYASGTPGSTKYRGVDDTEFCDGKPCGRGDGPGAIEPDKIGEIGLALLHFWQHTGVTKYRDAAIECARALAKHVRDGDDRHSPWPFRVYAKDDVARDEYSGHVVAAIRLFDELVRLRLDDVEAFARARATTAKWLFDHPMKNDVWGGYFEDIPIQKDPADNPNQYAPLQTARWLIEHPYVDPSWKAHVEHVFSFVKKEFADDVEETPGSYLGADLLSEQRADMAKMSSHTARWGAVHALWFEATGDVAAKETALRALAWASYWCDDRGMVKVGPDDREGYWFSDGYGDYVRHFLVAMAAVPEWAPPHEDHLLRSSSIVTSLDRSGDGLKYGVFDDRGDEVLRLSHAPKSVTLDGRAIDRVDDRAAEGFVVEPLASDVVVRIHRERGRAVAVAW